MHNKTRKNCIKLIKTIEKCKKVVYYEAINKEETGRGTMNNEGGGIVDRRDHDRCQELYVKYRQFMYWYVKKHFPDLPEEDIRDILQEVWTSLLNAIDKLYDKGDEGQFAWLIRVTQTKVIDYYRFRKRTEELGEKIGLAFFKHKTIIYFLEIRQRNFFSSQIVLRIEDIDKFIFIHFCEIVQRIVRIFENSKNTLAGTGPDMVAGLAFSL